MRTILILLCLANTAAAVDYPIVVCVQKRPNANVKIPTPEANVPYKVAGDTDLMIIQPDGSLTMLVDAGPREAIIDPCVSFDGRQVYYAKFHDVTAKATDGYTPIGGADIFRVDVATGETVQLTHGEMTPNAINEGRPAGKSFNTGPCELPEGLIAFTSTRNDLGRPKAHDRHVPQLFVMDQEGNNVEQTGFLNLMGALHPVVLTEGRIMWSTHEGQGVRDPTENGNRLWGLWASKPDGRTWEPLISAFQDAAIYHFHCQLSSGSIVCEEYYTSNNMGYGNLWRFSPQAAVDGKPPFGSPNYTSGGFSFAPLQMTALTPWTVGRDDYPAPLDKVTGKRVGKLTTPAAGPHNDLLATWSNFGPCTNNLSPTQPQPQATIVIIPGGEPTAGPAGMTVVKADPTLNFYQPKALVPYKAIYGLTAPAAVPFVPNDGEEPQLPAGTPFGLIGTSTFYKRDDRPGLNQWGQRTTNFAFQGSTAGNPPNSEIHAVRILSMEPRSFREDGKQAGVPGFTSHAQERLRIMGEVPLRKFNADGTPLLDVDGNPDTSFLAKIPADVPFTFQMLNADNQALNTSQTWHQVRPGEGRYDCGGCHAHSQVGTKFELTAAARPDYVTPDLTGKPVDVEYLRDVRPLILGQCTGCHDADEPAGGLDLATTAYNKLAADPAAKWTTASKYIQKFQSRVSLLSQKLLGTVPGDCGAKALPAADKRTFFRWIDLGCPQGAGWFLDATKPTLALSSPRRLHPGPLTEIKVGLFDHTSGLNLESLSITTDFAIGGHAAGSELASLFTEHDAIWTLSLDRPFTGRGNVTVSIRDQAGNRQRVSRTFTTGGAPTPAPDLAGLKRQLTEVIAQIAVAESGLEELRARKSDLEARIAAAEGNP